MKQKVEVKASDIIDYSFCKCCNTTFKTEGFSLSLIKQVYNNHCNTNKHKLALLNPEHKPDNEDIKTTLEKQQKQIDILIQTVKMLNEQKEQVELRCSRAEHHLRLLKEDLFGNKNKYGKEHENMLEYKSFNERLKALENGQQDHKVEEKQVFKEEVVKVEEKREVRFVENVEMNVFEKEEEIEQEEDKQDDPDIEQFNPYKLKEKMEFTNTFEFEDNNIMIIHDFSNIINQKDNEEENVDLLENIQFEYETLEQWLIFMEKNSSDVIDSIKIKTMKEELFTIIQLLERIKNNFTNPKYTMSNSVISKIYQMMLKYATKQYTIKDLI
jgi:hypothetical protein